MDQAEERHPGKKSEDIRAKVKLSQALRMEFHGLKGLIARVNDAIERKGEVVGLKAALKLARLDTIVLQDAFGRTARKAAERIKHDMTAGTDDKEDRQRVMEELAAYLPTDYGEKWADSVPASDGIRIRFPSVIEDWVAEAVALASDVFAHRAAVLAVQDQHFDGHPILFRDVETRLDDAIKTLGDGIATFNDYLKTRAELFKRDREASQIEDDGIGFAIHGELEGYLTISIDAIRATAEKTKAEQIAAKWITLAKDKAKLDILEESEGDAAAILDWNRLREEIGVEQ
jgi:hypothetical protein